MLRQKDVKKYKKKSKYDQILSLRKDGEYLLKNERPIKDNLIKTINQEKVTKFIEDILVNDKITHLLYRSNSKFEIDYYLNTKEKFFTHKTPLKAKNNDNITLRQVKKQTCLEMKNVVNNFRKIRKKMMNSMDNINKKKIKIFRKQLNIVENQKNDDLKQNRINGFIRAYNSIRKKYDISNNLGLYRNNSCVIYNYKKLNKNNLLKNKISKKNNSLMIKSISSDTYESDIKTNNFSNLGVDKNNNKLNNSLLPHVKLDVKDVYSRLYHNAVLLSPSSSVKNQRRPQSCKNKSSLSYDFANSPTYNPKIIFKLKKVIKSTSGKEFTFKITKDIIRRCFVKYSGGPPILGMEFFKQKREENKKSYDLNNIKVDDEIQEEEVEGTKKGHEAVNFYKLIDKKTGNSFLHLAVIGGYEEFVRYFLEKKSNINLKNFDGNTPLHLALYNRKKRINIIDILMEYHPRLDIKNKKDEIPFDLFTDEMKVKYGIDKLIIGKGI